MKTAFRILVWIHFIYLLSLPTLAVIAATVMFPEDDAGTQLLIFGFPAVVMYCLFLANGYSMRSSLPIALVQVLLVPVQIATGVYFFGGGSIWLFFVENAAVEISAFVLGIMIVAFPRVIKKDSSLTLLTILFIGVPCFIGGAIPHVMLVVYGYGAASPWIVLFATAFITALLEHRRTYLDVVNEYDKTGRSQSLEMRYDGGRIGKLLGLDANSPVVSPLWKGTDRTAINPRVHLFGWAAIVLPIIAGIIASIALA